MKQLVNKATHFIHSNFLVVLLSAYAFAAVYPNLGLSLRKIEFGQVMIGGDTVKITLSLLMLSFLLFNAGLGIKLEELMGIWKKPGAITAGFFANMFVPVLLIVLLLKVMNFWHDTDELQSMLVGLALIVSMPIAGSSTAWSQNANGNLSLSLGLVFLSTLLSPVTTPLLLNLFGYMTAGDYSADLHELAAQGTNAFMMITVVLPSVAGIITHFLLGEARTQAMKPYLKLLNFTVLIILNYSNAATSLPQSFSHPDFDFLSLILLTTAGLCIAAFASGLLIANWLKTDNSDKASLMFGLGMNNNGTGLVLAGATLADHPAVMLPMIFYTLVQQIVAAITDRTLSSRSEA